MKATADGVVYVGGVLSRCVVSADVLGSEWSCWVALNLWSSYEGCYWGSKFQFEQGSTDNERNIGSESYI